MRVLVAPDGFKGSLTAAEAAEAIAAGWARGRPGDELETVPLSDGGPGFLEALGSSLGGEMHETAARDPFGHARPARLLLTGGTAYVESADCCGLHLVAPPQRNPLQLSSAGLADLLLAAAELRARRVVVGLGGSATNDGGAGMLAALGLRLLDDAGLEVQATPRFLERLARVHFTPDRPRLPELVAATDVDSPLLGPHGASATFGPQKGASPRDVKALERSLGRLAEVLGRDLPGAAGLEHEPGAGAAGGLGYGLLVLGASAVRGFDLVSEAVGLPSRLARADVLVTGEGSLDAQSLRGKVVAGAAAEAAKQGCRCLVLAGRVRLDPGEVRAAGIDAAHSVVEVAGSLREARAKPALHLGRLAEQVARRI